MVTYSYYGSESEARAAVERLRAIGMDAYHLVLRADYCEVRAWMICA